MNTLFLAWQAPKIASASRACFPVGRLDAEPRSPKFRFRYTQGALRAHEVVGFRPLFAFPDFDTVYESDDLFPLFQNRILSSKRSDFVEYVTSFNLDPEEAAQDPLSVLAVSGGTRATDSLQVFPKIQLDTKGRFTVRFPLHGLRYLPESSAERVDQLKVGDELRVGVELNNPATRLAVTLHSEDYIMLGWAPRYLVDDLIQCVPLAPELRATVIRVNPRPSPINQRVLVEYSGKVPVDGREPMSTPDFQPVVT